MKATGEVMAIGPQLRSRRIMKAVRGDGDLGSRCHEHEEVLAPMRVEELMRAAAGRRTTSVLFAAV